MDPRDSVSDDSAVARITQIASLLANPTRVRVIRELLAGPRIVGEIVSALGCAQASVSKQLGLLRDAGLLCCRHDGRCREYGLSDPEGTRALLDAMQELGDKAAATPRARARRGRAG